MWLPANWLGQAWHSREPRLPPQAASNRTPQFPRQTASSSSCSFRQYSSYYSQLPLRSNPHISRCLVAGGTESCSAGFNRRWNVALRDAEKLARQANDSPLRQGLAAWEITVSICLLDNREPWRY